MSYPVTVYEENIYANTLEMMRGMHASYKRKWPDGEDIYNLTIMTKYIKIFTNRRIGGRVVAFVDKKTGDIYKPASWSSPAKHSRGNVNKEFGKEALDETGTSIRYLK